MGGMVVPNTSFPTMTDGQLTRYVRLVQLETMLNAPFLYHPKGSTGKTDSATAWARLRTIRAGQNLLTQGDRQPLGSGASSGPAPPPAPAAAPLQNLQPGEGRRLLATSGE